MVGPLWFLGYMSLDPCHNSSSRGACDDMISIMRDFQAQVHLPSVPDRGDQMRVDIECGKAHFGMEDSGSGRLADELTTGSA